VIDFHSRKLNKAEVNYPIHDKEMLAIISCLEQWDAELRGCGEFTGLMDHRNLEHFMTNCRLSERQVRWAELLSRYNFQLLYRPGKEGVVPDALSRRDQDNPINNEDEREKGRFIQLLPAAALRHWKY
jgi:hypothetical protein